MYFHVSCIFHKELEKLCFQHDMAFRDLSAKNPKYDRYHCDLLQWYIKFLIKSLLVVMFKPLFILFIIKTYAHNNSLE